MDRLIPIPICADGDVVICDDGVVRTARRRQAISQVAHPWYGARQIAQTVSPHYSPRLLSIVPRPARGAGVHGADGRQLAVTGALRNK